MIETGTAHLPRLTQEYQIALGGSKHASLQPTTRFGRGKASYSPEAGFCTLLELA